MEFIFRPAVAEVATQLLASRCLLLYQQNVEGAGDHQNHIRQLARREQQQQQEQCQQTQLSRQQLGRRMRGDVLLLTDPQPRLAELLPSAAFLSADAAATGTSDSYSTYLDTSITLWALSLPAALDSVSDIAVSAAGLQLSVQLLSQAGVRCMQVFYAEMAQQTAQGSASPEVRLLEEAPHSELMVSAAQLFERCCTYVQGQLRVLWGSGRWQQPLQLLQQGGGAALLQGLTLAVHANILKVFEMPRQQHAPIAVGELLEMLWAGTL
jgi:hypothetical protein